MEYNVHALLIPLPAVYEESKLSGHAPQHTGHAADQAVHLPHALPRAERRSSVTARVSGHTHNAVSEDHSICTYMYVYRILPSECSPYFNARMAE